MGPWDREAVCPRVHHFDAAERVLILEDLGDAERLDHALGRGFDASSVAARLGAFLGRVHGLGAEAGLAGRFANEAMRRLHGEHIFRLPLRENDFALPPELAEPAEALRADAALVALADAAHARYLEARAALVHGDVQAGNVLLAGERPVLLDAEIAHVGDPDFDLGTLLAHLALPAVAVGEGGRAVSALEAALAAAECADARAAVRYAGFELLRRTLGAARVAAVETAEASRAVLEVALTWIREPAARARDLPL